MKNNLKQLIFCIALPLILGVVSGLLTRNSMSAFDSLVKPPLSPPGWLFPVVWTILYAAMGFASYLVLRTDDNVTERNRALAIYLLQLIVNVVWPLIFFVKEQYALAFIWLFLLWVLVLLTIILFYNISKPAAYIMIPYLAWVTFAAYLNLSIAILN